MRKLSIIIGLFCLAFGAALLACKAPGSRPKPNILLITLDTVRWDHISCYGRSEATTPVIDKLAGEAVKYQYAMSPSSWTLPAHASLFTGVIPTRHGAHYVTTDTGPDAELFQANKLDPELPTLAEELKKAGYGTGAVISGPLLHSRFGMNKGFDYYDDKNLYSPKISEFNRNAHETTSLGLQWLKHHLFESGEKPFFLFLNYYDPHTPYRPPGNWGDPDIPMGLCDIHSGHYDNVFKGVRELTDEEHHVLISQYDGEIRFVDSQIKWLLFELKKLDLYDSTMIVVTSDHGESFGEHQLLGHGRALYEDLIRVPLIVKYPLNDKKVAVKTDPVSTMSLMPTILEYIGHPVPSTVTSGSLHDRKQVLIAEIFRDVGWITGFGKRFDRDVKVIYEGDNKLIWNSNGKRELYNISTDPHESHNLSEKLPDTTNRLQLELLNFVEESKTLSTATSPEINNELRESLKALGYIQ